MDLNNPSIIHAAKFIAPTLALLASGYSLAFSQNGVKQLYDEPARVTTPVFKRTFYAGAYTQVPFSLVSSIASGFLRWKRNKSQLNRADGLDPN